MEDGSGNKMSKNVIAAARHLDTQDNDQPEPFRVEVDILWPDFKAVVMAQYENPPSDVVIKYADEDNEMITMTSQEELQIAIKLAEDNCGIMQLEVKGIEKKKTLLQLREDAERSVDAALILPAIPRRKPIPSLRLSMAEKLANDAMSSNKSKSQDKKQEKVDEVPKVTEKKDKIESYTLEIDGEQMNKNQTEYEKMSGSDTAPVMPYPEFVEFMEKLKHELRSEIVHDVTKKTVKQVMRGLDTTPIKKPLRDPWCIGREDIKHAHPIYLHEGIICNNCQKTILGCRYKCGNCADYDLCEQCEGKYGIHNVEHVFIKLRRPCKEMLYRDGKKTPLLKRVLYKADTGSDSLERIVERKREKMKKKAEKMIEKEKKKEDKLKRKLEKYEGLKDSPKKRERYDKVLQPIYPHASQDYQALGASFIRDITIPDGTNVQPGTKMLKTWRLLNSGSVAWKDNFKLRLMYGTIPTVKTEVSVPCLQPGEEGDVSAELTAPEQPGRYQSHWKLFADGLAFGHRVWVMINVVPREVLEPKFVDTLKMVTSSDQEKGEKKEVVKTQAPEEQTVVRDIEVPVASKTDTPLYRLIPSMLEQADDTDKQEPLAIVNTQPSPINDLNKQDSVKDESLNAAKMECSLNVETDAVELNLNSAVAVMEKLTLSEPVDVPSTKTSKDLLSFEFLDRTPPKISQTATPNNTPLDVSPPKSPITTPRLETVLSASSSMELVNGDNDEYTPLLSEYPHERIQSLELKPDILDDVESLESYSDDDSSCSDDFFLVPLPDCFDTSKPLPPRSSLALRTESDDVPETENQSEVSESSPPASQLTVDDMLQVSTNVDTRPLTPEVTSPEIVRDVCETEASAGVNEEVAQGISESEGAVGEQVSPESPILDSACYASASGRPLTEEEHQTPLMHLDPGCSQAAERTVLPPVSSTENGADASAVAAATAEQQEFAKQLLDVAVTAAANAASHAFYKVKDVFNTWQAKDMERKQQQQKVAQNVRVTREMTPSKSEEYRPPASEWTPPKTTYVPPKSDWTPPEDTYVPPQSTWTPPPQDTQPRRRETTPMDRLLEMGFADRSLNQQLLEQYDNDVNQVISIIIDMHKEDWAGRRH